jgi:hypothetical protein
MPSKVLQKKSPYQVLHHKLPTLDHIRVFGSLCYVSTLTANRSKFAPRARRCVFIGFKPGTKGYVAYDLNTKEIVVSRNVEFHELILPYATHHSEILQSTY